MSRSHTSIPAQNTPEPLGVFASDATRWLAQQPEAAAAAGHLVYAVKTTGIYCRPTCPSRPKRENVVFFLNAEAARNAGFRACKRCSPDTDAADSLCLAAITAAARKIDAAIAGERPVPALKTLAAGAGFSPFHFHRLFRKTLGLTPKTYGIAARSQRMAEQLQTSASVTDAIHGAGYSSSSRFYETASARLGMAPAAHRQGGIGETIHFAIFPCSLGLALVATTAKGICAIHFGDSGDLLTAELVRRFPKAQILPGDAGIAGMLAQVVARVEAPGTGASLPLDVRGTAFQERVWQALQAIPAGSTATYLEIAQTIGAPKAARAVAGACAANPAAVLIPCHRVVRANGDLSGYRWGVARKAELLKREAGRQGLAQLPNSPAPRHSRMNSEPPCQEPR